MNKIGRLSMAVALFLAGPGGGDSGHASEMLFSGGDILTMSGDAPQYVEALAVKDGKIIYAGDKSIARKALTGEVTEVDLKGRTLLPGFIDGHGHLPDYVISWKAPDLSPPPVGDVTSISDLQAKLRKFIADTKAPSDRLVLSDINTCETKLAA